jgi:hypothetical protein
LGNCHRDRFRILSDFPETITLDDDTLRDEISQGVDREQRVYNFWRPVTAIRAGDADGNDQTVGDRFWETFLNTPPIPEYPSTHSVLGGAAAEVLARPFRDDTIAFTTASGPPFAGITRSYTSFSEAAHENADSRVYAGIHFRTATRHGVSLGRKIGAFGVKHYLEPIHKRPLDD